MKLEKRIIKPQKPKQEKEEEWVNIVDGLDGLFDKELDAELFGKGNDAYGTLFGETEKDARPSERVRQSARPIMSEVGSESAELIKEIQDYLDSGMWRHEACMLSKKNLEHILSVLKRDVQVERFANSPIKSRKEMYGDIDMLQGNISRMCVTHDKNEFDSNYQWALYRLRRIKGFNQQERFADAGKDLSGARVDIKTTERYKGEDR